MITPSKNTSIPIAVLGNGENNSRRALERGQQLFAGIDDFGL